MLSICQVFIISLQSCCSRRHFFPLFCLFCFCYQPAIMLLMLSLCNQVYCIHVPGHVPLICFFPVLFLFDWVGVLRPQLSKVLKPVRWAGSVPFPSVSLQRQVICLLVRPVFMCSSLSIDILVICVRPIDSLSIESG